MFYKILAAMFAATFLMLAGCDKKPTVKSAPPSTMVESKFEYPQPFPMNYETDITLEMPVTPEAQHIEYEKLPSPVWQYFPLPDVDVKERQYGHALAYPHSARWMYGIMSIEEMAVLLRQNKISNFGFGYAGGQYGYYQREEVYDYETYDPLQWGYVVWYGQYLNITFPDRDTMHIQVLNSPHREDPPTEVEIPKFAKNTIFSWVISGLPYGAPEDWAKGKVIKSSLQNGYASAETKWSGGENYKLPADHWTSFFVEAKDPTTKKVLWKWDWAKYL